MAKIVKEELWKPADIIFVTTNGYINKQGALVMGRGAALQATKYYPNIAFQAATKAMMLGQQVAGNVYEYNLIPIVMRTRDNFNAVGLFQVKYRYDEKADLELIKKATTMLANYAKLSSNLSFRINYPGIGFGGLTKEVVGPIIEELPGNVTVCYY